MTEGGGWWFVWVHTGERPLIYRTAYADRATAEGLARRIAGRRDLNPAYWIPAPEE